MTEDRDPTIGALLDRLPPPPAPTPAFWDDLREQLDGGPRVVELRPVGPALRSPTRRRLVAALVAAAVIAAGVVGITKAVRDDDSERVVPANPSTTATTISEVPSLILSTATQWMQDLVQGDVEGAWEMVGPQSREMVDHAAFAAMANDLVTQWEPWVSGVDLQRDVLPLTHTSDELWVVVLGTVQRDQTRALVVHLTGTQVQVEPFLPGTALSLVSFPIDGSNDGPAKIRSGASIELHVDGDAQDSLVAFDGRTVAAPRLTRDATNAITAVSTTGLTVGHHDILVAEVTRDGTLAFVDLGFEVSG
jgi:hypothetical protein